MTFPKLSCEQLKGVGNRYIVLKWLTVINSKTDTLLNTTQKELMKSLPLKSTILFPRLRDDYYKNSPYEKF